MDDELIRFGEEYFEYRDKKYRVVRLVAMKHPVTREWVEAVLYNEITADLNKPHTHTVNESVNVPGLFVREKSDFEAKFTNCVRWTIKTSG